MSSKLKISKKLLADTQGSCHVEKLKQSNMEMVEKLLATNRNDCLIPKTVQNKMEAAFEADFSQVRIYESLAAVSVGAIAFTTRDEICFAPGMYDPWSLPGQIILGHELTHVLQQRAGRVQGSEDQGISINADPVLEAEADWAGFKAAQGESVGFVGKQSYSIQKAPRIIQRIPSQDDIKVYKYVANLRFGIQADTDMQLGAYTFHIDQYGRVELVEGSIPQGIPWTRVAADTITPLIKYADDHNGHIIADIFGGPTHGANFIGMTEIQNTGTRNGINLGQKNTWNRAEQWIRKYQKNHPNNHLVIRVELGYDNRFDNQNFFRPLALRLDFVDRTKGQLYENPWTYNGQDYNNNPGQVFDNIPVSLVGMGAIATW